MISLDIQPYVTLLEAEDYFSTRMNTDPWDYATETGRLKALKTATRLIDNLAFKSDKLLPDQYNEFPRIDYNPTPDSIKIATCEIAIRLLDDVELEQEMSLLFTDSQHYASVSTGQTPKVVMEHIRAGIPSTIAWIYLKPYLRDPSVVTISRAN